MTTTYYKATHKQSGKWTVDSTELTIGKEIWALMKSEATTEFLSLLQENPDNIEWEIIEKKDYDKAIDCSRVDPTSFLFLNRGSIKRNKIPVALISENHVENFPSVAALVRHLDGIISKSKITKMVNDPFISFEGYSVIKL